MISPFDLGQSGYNLTIQVGSDGKRVLKSACSEVGEDASRRLQAQFNKHVELNRLGSMHPILTPRVYGSFTNNGYSMEYVQGTPLGYALRTISRKESLMLAEQITQYFDSNLDKATEAEYLRGQFHDKLESLTRFFNSIGDPNISELAFTAIEVLQLRMTDRPIPLSRNHGDFSFENLIVSRGRPIITALDFLDSPFETILIDIGRLWLDLTVGWWADGLRPNPNTFLNSLDIRAEIEKRLRGFGLGTEDFDLWACFAALRVVPYTTNPTRKALLKLTMNKIVREYS